MMGKRVWFVVLLVCMTNIISAQVDVEYTKLVWNDEFDGSTNLDATKWHHQTVLPNGNSWYNNEVQHYTDRTANSFVQNGNLSIIAKRENYTQQNVTKNFTSARLNSKFAFTYGRVDVRAKIPIKKGTWPAIWMLGKNVKELGGFFDAQYGTTNWPTCGEIDIMEYGIYANNYIGSAIHTASSSGSTVNKGGKTVSNLGTDFHVYSMNWSPNQISFLIDNQIFYTYNPAVKNQQTWPFDLPQYILLNVAIGGVAGAVQSDFQQDEMVVDYVRIYQKADTVIATGDTLAPQNFILAQKNINSSAIELKFQANNETDSIEFFIKGDNRQFNVKSVSNIEKTVTLYGLTPNTEYTIEGYAKDKLNHQTNTQILKLTTTSFDGCRGTSSSASQGNFTTGYEYAFEPLGDDIVAEYTLLDTDKSGVEAFLSKSTSSTTEFISNHRISNRFIYRITSPSTTDAIDYSVRFAYSGGNSSTSNFAYKWNTKCSSSISSNLLDDEIVFQNPASQNLEIQSRKPIEEMVIYNLVGQPVFQTNEFTTKYDVSSLSSGIYFLKLSIGSQSQIFKLKINH